MKGGLKRILLYKVQKITFRRYKRRQNDKQNECYPWQNVLDFGKELRSQYPKEFGPYGQYSTQPKTPAVHAEAEHVGNCAVVGRTPT